MPVNLNLIFPQANKKISCKHAGINEFYKENLNEILSRFNHTIPEEPKPGEVWEDVLGIVEVIDPRGIEDILKSVNSYVVKTYPEGWLRSRCANDFKRKLADNIVEAVQKGVIK